MGEREIVKRSETTEEKMHNPSEVHLQPHKAAGGG